MAGDARLVNVRGCRREALQTGLFRSWRYEAVHDDAEDGINLCLLSEHICAGQDMVWWINGRDQ